MLPIDVLIWVALVIIVMIAFFAFGGKLVEKCPHCGELIDQSVRLRANGYLLVTIALLNLGFLLWLHLWHSPIFSQMFKDFGSSDSIPPLTQFILSTGYAVGSTIVLAALIVFSIYVPKKLSRRNILLGVVACAIVFLIVFQLWAEYLPIFNLAGNIEA
ncbi:MAG: hypothetical protein JRJ87_23835 [Deltaproteobacteria bacterium]|nr:hypothetical protein [Deltaproteobacteria bacterium]